MEPVEGGEYKDKNHRRMTVTRVDPHDRQGRDVQGYLLEPGAPQPVPYSTSIGMFRANWTERLK